MNPTCTIDGCTGPVKSRGWCKRHYIRWWRTGDVHKTRRPGPKPVPAAERFWEKVDVGHPLGCWEWTAYRDDSGYGYFRAYDDEAPQAAHRCAYEFLIGPIPEGRQLDHLCRNPGCVNPDHLEAVTPRENFLRSENPSARTFRKNRCQRGHALVGESVRWEPNGTRRCRECQLLRDRHRQRGASV